MKTNLALQTDHANPPVHSFRAWLETWWTRISESGRVETAGSEEHFPHFDLQRLKN